MEPDSPSLTKADHTHSDADSGYDDHGVITIPVVRTVHHSDHKGRKTSTTSTDWISFKRGDTPPRDAMLPDYLRSSPARDSEEASRPKVNKSSPIKERKLSVEATARKKETIPIPPEQDDDTDVKHFTKEIQNNNHSQKTYHLLSVGKNQRYAVPRPTVRDVSVTNTVQYKEETTKKTPRRKNRSKSADGRLGAQNLFSPTYSKVISPDTMRRRKNVADIIRRDCILEEEYYKLPYEECNREIIHGRMSSSETRLNALRRFRRRPNGPGATPEDKYYFYPPSSKEIYKNINDSTNITSSSGSESVRQLIEDLLTYKTCENLNSQINSKNQESSPKKVTSKNSSTNNVSNKMKEHKPSEQNKEENHNRRSEKKPLRSSRSMRRKFFQDLDPDESSSPIHEEVKSSLSPILPVDISTLPPRYPTKTTIETHQKTESISPDDFYYHKGLEKENQQPNDIPHLVKMAEYQMKALYPEFVFEENDSPSEFLRTSTPEKTPRPLNFSESSSEYFRPETLTLESTDSSDSKEDFNASSSEIFDDETEPSNPFRSYFLNDSGVSHDYSPDDDRNLSSRCDDWGTNSAESSDDIVIKSSDETGSDDTRTSNGGRASSLKRRKDKSFKKKVSFSNETEEMYYLSTPSDSDSSVFEEFNGNRMGDEDSGAESFIEDAEAVVVKTFVFQQPMQAEIVHVDDLKLEETIRREEQMQKKEEQKKIQQKKKARQKNNSRQFSNKNSLPESLKSLDLETLNSETDCPKSSALEMLQCVPDNNSVFEKDRPFLENRSRTNKNQRIVPIETTTPVPEYDTNHQFKSENHPRQISTNNINYDIENSINKSHQMHPKFNENDLTRNDTNENLTSADRVNIYMSNNLASSRHEIFLRTKMRTQSPTVAVSRVRVPFSTIQDQWDWIEPFLHRHREAFGAITHNNNSSASSGDDEYLLNANNQASSRLQKRSFVRNIPIETADSPEPMNCGSPSPSGGSSSGCYSTPSSPAPSPVRSKMTIVPTAL